MKPPTDSANVQSSDTDAAASTLPGVRRRRAIVAMASPWIAGLAAKPAGARASMAVAAGAFAAGPKPPPSPATPARPASPNVPAIPRQPAAPATTSPRAALAAPTPAAGPLPDFHGRTLRAVTEQAYPPLNQLNPATGQSEGWEIDVVDEIARRLNLAPRWSVASWDAMILAVREGQFDVGMDGIAITPARAAQVAFSEPYMRAELHLLVRTDEARFADAAGFRNHTALLAGAQPGTTSYAVTAHQLLADHDVRRRVKLFDSFGATAQALRAGDVDVVLADATAARMTMRRAPGAFKLIGEGLAGEDFGFIFTPGSPLVAPFNAALRTLRADGTLARLTTRWFGAASAAQR